MARPAADAAPRPPTWPAALARALLEPAPGRAAFALRLAFVSTLAALLTQVYGTPSPALTTYFSFFVMRADRMSSVLRSLTMVLLITAVLGLTLLLAQRVVDAPAWRVASMAVVSFSLLFMASASKLGPLAGTIAMIMTYSLAQLGGVIDGELATRGLLYVWLFMAIPAGVSLVVALFAAPSPRSLLQRALAERLRAAARALRDPDGAAKADLARLRRAGDEPLHGYLRLAAMERSSPRDDIPALRRAIDASASLLAAIDFGAGTPCARLPQATNDELALGLEEMATLFARGGCPVGRPVAITHADMPGSLATAHRDAIARALSRFGDPAEAMAAPPRRAGFLAADAFTNPDHVRHALKATAAAMACYIAYQVLDWPGIHTCLITCYIVALGTVADSVEKLSLRLAGCLAGSVLGIGAMVFVVPALTSITALLAIVFAGTLLAAWIAAGSPRVAYAGFQLGFAFLLCVLQGAGPAFDLTIARDRIVGIAFGNLMVHAVFTLCWPVSVAARIDQGLANVLGTLASLAHATDPALSRRLGAQVQATAGAVEADLELARYEPEALHNPPRGLADARRTLAAAASLEPALQLAAVSGAVDAGIAARIGHLAGAGSGNEPAGAREESGPLRSVIESRLRVLEEAVAGGAQTSEAHHATA